MQSSNSLLLQLLKFLFLFLLDLGSNVNPLLDHMADKLDEKSKNGAGKN
jgi:hypothetical protein